MSTKRKVFAFGLAALMAMTSLPLMAYDNTGVPAPTDVETATIEPNPAKPMAAGPKSPTNYASAGRYSTDVDNILSLTGWTDVSVNNWLAFAGWDNSLFSLGYARKIGGLYLGAWYNGNIVASGKETLEFVGVTYDAYGNPVTEESGYQDIRPGTPLTQPWTYSNNRLSLILGIADMGIRLDVRENYLSKKLPAGAWSTTIDKTTGSVSGTNEISDYKYLRGWTDIYAGWGMTFPLAGLTIKPSAQLGAQLYSSEQNTVYKTNAANNPVPPPSAGSPVTYNDITASTQAGENTAFIRPNILIGTTVNGLPWGLGVGLEYTINFDLYTSSYDLYGGSESVAGDVSWVYDDNFSSTVTSPAQSTTTAKGGVTVEEKSRLRQIITPSLTWGTDLGDNIKLALKLDLPFTLGSAADGGKYKKTWSTTTTTLTGGSTTVTETNSTSYNSGESETSVFGFAPALYVGTQIAAIPNRLTLNLGLTNTVKYYSEKILMKPEKVGVTTTRTTVDGLVTVDSKTTPGAIGTKTDYSYVNESWTDLKTKITAGFTFFFSPNFLIDTYLTAQPADSSGTTNNTGGIQFRDTNFWNDIVQGNFGIMFTVKK
jgi:hypothetical protein